MRTLFLSALLVTGCGSLPTQTIDGVAIYVRSVTEVNEYCLAHVTADQVAPSLAPTLAGCYVPADHLIMVAPERPELIYHEMRHARGWKHRGPCNSSQADPDGRKPDGTPCEWYR
jgi:hypothetical protein